MKSLTRVVLFVLCVQSVCCYSSETWFDFFIQTIEGSPTIEELNRIFYKCDMSQMQDMFERNPRIFCLDQSTISKRDTDLTEIKRNLKQCVDSSYFHVIDSIHKVAHNVLKILCENSDEYVKELIELFENKSMDKNRLFNQLFLQASSCVFSEKEVMNVSKSVDNVLEFYMNLIRGQEKQCGVVKRIQKCTLKNKLNDTEKVFVERLAILVDLFLKAFECKFDDDIDVSLNFCFEKKFQ